MQKLIEKWFREQMTTLIRVKFVCGLGAKNLQSELFWPLNVSS